MSGTNGLWTDFISDWLRYAEGFHSPDSFKLWTGVALVAGALERRVWARAGEFTTFPSLYTLLVAHPGVGKQVIERARELWTQTVEPGTKLKAFHVAPDSMTKASLIDNIAKAKTTRVAPTGPALTYHSLLVPAEEFSVLLPAYDLEYIGVLNSLYGNKPLHEESRRTGTVRELSIENPQLNILGGTQPSWLASVFPEDAWNTGIARRLIMIYSAEAPIRDIFFTPDVDPDIKERLLRSLGKFSQMFGQLQWTPSGAERLRQWHLAGGPPAPTHSKLVHYVRGRTQHLIKLAIIAAVSRLGTVHEGIDTVDVNRGIEWLLEAETTMPDIFRAMIGKSDKQVIDEMHLFLQSLYLRSKQKPVDGALLRQFLLERVPHDKIEGLLAQSERANIIGRMAGAGDLYVPRPRHEYRVE